jgi:hypothetical protein
MLIENQFIYIPIPKNASSSIIYSILQWRLKVDFGDETLNKIMYDQIDSNQPFAHYHNTYDYYKNTFPNKKTIAIRRPSVDRFISALKYMILMCKQNNIKLKYNFEKLNEDEIIEIFSKIFYELNCVKEPTIKNGINLIEYHNHINDIIKKNITDDYLNFNKMLLDNFRSQYFWGLNKCDIIIDMSELNQFTNIIKKIKPNFNLIKTNKSDNIILLNIKKSDKIIDFVNKYIDYNWLNEK